jgi:tetratricopeptide (TPR) repeat protein
MLPLNHSCVPNKQHPGHFVLTRNQPESRRRRAAAPAEDEIRARLRQILERHSQAEIARRCGVPPSCVSRYLSGTAIPAAFCRALVKEFGVNPAWLLAGEGAPFLSDVAEGASKLAGDLLDVVRGLNAVSNARIGSLGGKHHLRVLRELGQAMARYEELRSRLNQRSAPILRQLLPDLRAALDKPNLDLARDLCRTAAQLERFCEDPQVSLELAVLQGRLELIEENLPAALELTRKAVMLTLHRGARLGGPEIEAISESVSALHDWLRFDEARRVSQAALALASNEALESEAAHWLQFVVADMQILTGELADGIRTLAGIRGRLSGTRALRADGVMAHALRMSCALDTQSALVYGTDSEAKAERLLGLAVCMESEQDIETALAYVEQAQKDLTQSYWHKPATLMLRSLQGEKRGLAAAIRAFAETTLPSLRFVYPFTYGPIVGAQLFRRMGRVADARECYLESCRMISRLPEWFCLSVVWQARHQRSALELGSKPQQQQAREFFGQLARQGYRCFTELA